MYTCIYVSAKCCHPHKIKSLLTYLLKYLKDVPPYVLTEYDLFFLQGVPLNKHLHVINISIPYLTKYHNVSNKYSQYFYKGRKLIRFLIWVELAVLKVQS